MAKLKRWTKEEDEFIRDHGETTPRRDMAKRLPGRSVQAVKVRCTALGVFYKEVKRRDGVVVKKWTLEEMEKLEALCGRVTLTEAAQILGRSPDSLKSRVKGMDMSWKSSSKSKKSPKRKKKTKKKARPKKKAQKKPQPKLGEPLAVTLDLIHERAVFVKACFLLERVKQDEAAVSLWWVMSQLKLAQPWDDNPDRAFVLEAAERLGMRIYETKGMVMLK